MRASSTKLLRDYYYLTKPGIIRGNLITAVAGFLLASGHHIHIGLGIAVLSGLALVIASACVSNNYLDRGLDQNMRRTARRPLVTGKITGRSALLFAAGLLVIGSFILGWFVNNFALLLALFGFVAYVAVYGYYKRRSTLGTAIGSVSGAVPPVVGYVAVGQHIDSAAICLFIILVCWQMPHFFAIAVYRLKDYTAAKLPVLPVKKGLNTTKIQCVLYILGYGLASLSLTLLGYTGKVYFVTMIIISLLWLILAIKGFKAISPGKWARQLFFFSLVAITLQSTLIAANAFLP